MKIVLDTNIFISALIKDNFSRKIITNSNFDFFVPSYSFSEILKYKSYICKKSGITEKKFKELLNKILEYSEIVPPNYYKEYISKANKLISDEDDVPFLACALALNACVWSDDKHFQKQKKVKIMTSQNLAKKFLRKI